MSAIVIEMPTGKHSAEIKARPTRIVDATNDPHYIQLNVLAKTGAHLMLDEAAIAVYRELQRDTPLYDILNSDHRAVVERVRESPRMSDFATLLEIIDELAPVGKR